jgi:hypothetical protein
MWIAAASLAVATAALADEPMKNKQAGTTTKAVNVNAADLKWAEAPPDLPKGAQVAVLYGDPFKAGPYALRLKAPDGYKIPPHWHTQDEQLTVLSGTLMLYMGDTMKSPAHTLDTAGFHYLPGKMHHAAEMKGQTIVQIQGTGPFDIHYLNAADNPNPKTTMK